MSINSLRLAARNSCFMLSVPTTAPVTAFSVRDRPYSANCWGVAVPRPSMVVTRFSPASRYRAAMSSARSRSVMLIR